MRFCVTDVSVGYPAVVTDVCLTFIRVMIRPLLSAGPDAGIAPLIFGGGRDALGLLFATSTN